MTVVAVDAMGGDNAPVEIIKGAIEAVNSCDDIKIKLVGIEDVVKQELAKYEYDIILSGHIHGGIMRLPYLGGVISPQIRLFPKYSGGLYTINKAKMILSRGLGTHTIRFRFFNPPELVVVNPINRER